MNRGSHEASVEIEIQHTELREVAYGFPYVISVSETEYNEEDEPRVEIWIDTAARTAAPALANIRLKPEDAVRLAEQLLISARRAE